MHGFSGVAIGLSGLLKGIEKGVKSREFIFITEAKQSFKDLKEAFTKAPFLIHFDLAKKIRLETNASKFAIAGTLLQQEGPEGSSKRY